MPALCACVFFPSRGTTARCPSRGDRCSHQPAIPHPFAGALPRPARSSVPSIGAGLRPARNSGPVQGRIPSARASKSVWRHSPRTLRRGWCPRRPAAPRPSVGAGPRPARGPVPFVGAAFGHPGVWGPRPHGGHRGRSPLYINWGRAGLENWQTGSERNCVFPLRLPSVYQNESEKHWGARDCGNGGVREKQNVYQKSTMRTSAARMSGFFAALEAFFNLFRTVTGVVQPCHPVSGNVFLLLPEKWA